MEALQKELDLLEAKKKELLEKMEGEKPVLRKELAALLAARSTPDPVVPKFEHYTCYLASGLGMTTIDPFPDNELNQEVNVRNVLNQDIYDRMGSQNKHNAFRGNKE
jgi:hypothetical protein